MSLKEIIISQLLINLLRYFLVAGSAFALYYVIFKKRWNYKKIQPSFPKVNDYQREIIYSIITISIFLGVALLILATPLNRFSQRYDNISQYGWTYWILSFFIMIFIHDTYFYWLHRFMHAPRVYKVVHKIHHKSINPSPWAAYSFHPVEAFFEAGVIFLIVFLVPFHHTALFAFLAFMIVYNVYGHLGYELYPKKFNRNFIGRWINTSVNHNLHHKYFHGNYGLYFLFWDRIMGTIREDYDEAFSAIDLKRSEKKPNQEYVSKAVGL